jgi:hypothetical protein
MPSKKRNWIAKATRRMKRKKTLGKFGKATTKKIAAAKKRGGLAAKRAVFAENMAKISRRRKKRR